jgi:gamma-glutamylcyclotransferase (GGCT)/AIG2-like uncharacterized protein YtfP
MTEVSLFVYGSFADGMVHFSKINQYVVQRQKAFAFGEVYRLPSGFPVYFPVEQGQQLEAHPRAVVDRVPGEFVTLQAPDLVFKILDEFHGFSPLMPEKSLYKKEIVEIQTSAGDLKKAIIYVLNRSKLPKHSVRVPQGDWVTDLLMRPPITESLSEKQITYIQRLSKSSGREIVPIDLELYRELMKLDLIVDKGRRLALSRFGKEVARFLPD